jgi:hypothetical protein
MIVAAVGLIAFSVAYAVIKLKTSHEGRRNLTNEENPQMEWDDSGLNIIENPLEVIAVRKFANSNRAEQSGFGSIVLNF